MIRTYLDWNVISKLKGPAYSEIRTFLLENANSILIPFTPTHFMDSEKSHGHPKFLEDLETMEALCKNHFMQWKNGDVEPGMISPKAFFEQYQQSPKMDISSVLDMDKAFTDMDRILGEMGQPAYGSVFKEFAKSYNISSSLNGEGPVNLATMFPQLSHANTLWDVLLELGPLAKELMEDRSPYKNMRASLVSGGYSMLGTHGHLTDNQGVLRIDAFLEEPGFSGDFTDFIQSTFKNQKEEPTRYNWFMHAYLMLDLIGFRSDPLKDSTNTMLNVSYDGEHALYGAYCDFLVTDDPRMRDKASVLYRYLNRPTRVIAPSHLIAEVSRQLHPLPSGFYDLAVYGSELFWRGKEVERAPSDDPESSDTVAVELAHPLLAFFTHGLRSEQIGKGQRFIFRKAFQNYSSFLYPAEFENALLKTFNACGVDPGTDLKDRIAHFMNDEHPVPLYWYNGDDVVVIIDREADLWRPSITVVHAYKEQPPSSV